VTRSGLATPSPLAGCEARPWRGAVVGPAPALDPSWGIGFLSVRVLKRKGELASFVLFLSIVGLAFLGKDVVFDPGYQGPARASRSSEAMNWCDLPPCAGPEGRALLTLGRGLEHTFGLHAFGL